MNGDWESKGQLANLRWPGKRPLKQFACVCVCYCSLDLKTRKKMMKSWMKMMRNGLMTRRTRMRRRTKMKMTLMRTKKKKNQMKMPVYIRLSVCAVSVTVWFWVSVFDAYRLCCSILMLYIDVTKDIWRFVTFYISALEILLLTYLLTYLFGLWKLLSQFSELTFFGGGVWPKWNNAGNVS